MKKKAKTKSVKIPTKELYIKNATYFFAYLFVVWGFYRLLFQAPAPLDDVLLKPLIWLIPLFLILKKENRGLDSVGVTGKRLVSSIYIALFLGFIFSIQGLAINFLKYRGLDFRADIGASVLTGALLVSAIAAICEELVFRGYIFGRLSEYLKNEKSAILISTLAWVAIHMPVAIFDWRLSFVPLMQYLVLVAIYGFGATILYARIKNIAAPILLHVLWTWPIILFR